MQFRHTDFDDTVNVTQENPLYTAAKYFLAAITAIVVLYAASGLLVDTIAEHMDYDTEIWIGEKFARHSQESLSPELAAQQAYLEKLLAAIPKTGLPPLPYHIRLIADREPNAQALPGGLIRVHAGLLELVPTENGLTFILGHELGHYADRDHLKGLGRGLVFTALSLVFLGESDASSKLVGKVLNASSLRYSRGQEQQADVWGLKLLAARYGHVGGAEDFFTAIRGSSHDLPRWAEFLSTHPVSETRINAIHDHAKRLGYAVQSTIPQPYYHESAPHDVR